MYIKYLGLWKTHVIPKCVGGPKRRSPVLQEAEITNMWSRQCWALLDMYFPLPLSLKGTRTCNSIPKGNLGLKLRSQHHGWPRPERYGESNVGAVHVLLALPFSDPESLGLFSLWFSEPQPYPFKGSLRLRPMYQVLWVAQIRKCGRSSVGAVSCSPWYPFSSFSVCEAVCLLVVWTSTLNLIV